MFARLDREAQRSEIVGINRYAELFFQLADQRQTGQLTRFAFTPRELPQAAMRFIGGALLYQYGAILRHQHGSNNIQRHITPEFIATKQFINLLACIGQDTGTIFTPLTEVTANV